MHAYLIVCPDLTTVEGKIKEITKKLSSTRVDFTLQKVADLKDLKSFTRINLSTNTSIVVSSFNSATTETQNGFLKSLEEPQEKLSYILTSSNLDGILPTIISRCEVLEIAGQQQKINPEKEKELKEFLSSLPAKKLAYVANIKDRAEAIEFISNLITVVHKDLVNNPSSSPILAEAIYTLKALKQNGNVSLQLTNFIVNI